MEALAPKHHDADEEFTKNIYNERTPKKPGPVSNYHPKGNQEQKPVISEEALSVDWTWHVILSRSRLTTIIAANDDSLVAPIDECAPDLSLGWNLMIVRLKPKPVGDDCDFPRQGKAILRGCPWVHKETKDGVPLFPGAMDLSMLEHYEQEHEGPEDPLLICPNSTNYYFMAGARVLLRWSIFQHAKEEPLTLVQKALHHLYANPAHNVNNSTELALDEDLKQRLELFGISEHLLRQSRSITPSQIKFHLAPELIDDMAFISEVQHTARKLFPDAQQSTCGPCLRNSRARIERIFWLMEFSIHMEQRFRMLYDSQRSAEKHFRGRDSIQVGTEDFWAYGNQLCNLPANSIENNHTSKDSLPLKQLYQKTAELLSSRPWGQFDSDEILKITLTIHGVGEFTKWAIFCSRVVSNVDPDCKACSPMGQMQLFHKYDDIAILYRRLQAGASSVELPKHAAPPDRLYVASQDLASVHYDSVLLLEHLFGPALLPADYLPCGIIPLLAAETGVIPTNDSDSPHQSFTSERPLNYEESNWLHKCLLPVAAFVKDERSMCDRNGNCVIRTYAVNENGEPTAKGSDTIVTITYNVSK